MAAKGTKPGAKPEAQEEAGAPPKSKKKLIIIVIAVVLVALIGVGAMLFLKSGKSRHGNAEDQASSAEQEAPEEHAAPAKFVEVGTFTTNLAPDEGDRYVQVGVSFKITKPELEEQIKNTKPEIQHIINMLLQSKLPSELATPEGKNRLAEQIKEQSQEALGLRKKVMVEDDEHGTKAPKVKVTKGLEEVLFTSFLIQ